MPTVRQRLLTRIVNVWPPYLGAGIRVELPAGDPHTVRATMQLKFYNRNLFGTHFGGSLYSMCDPWFLYLYVQHLGDDYLVWDKAAGIEFLRPGRGPVSATFHVDAAQIDAARAAVERDGKFEPQHSVDVTAPDGEVVARISKRLWIRRKRAGGG